MLPSVDVQCPYCGEWISLLIDDSAGVQDYVEDCQVCCRPIRVGVTPDEEGAPRVAAWREDDS